MLRSDIGSEKISEKPGSLEHPSAKQASILADTLILLIYYSQFLPHTTFPVVLCINILISSIHHATRLARALCSVFTSHFLLINCIPRYFGDLLSLWQIHQSKHLPCSCCQSIGGQLFGSPSPRLYVSSTALLGAPTTVDTLV